MAKVIAEQEFVDRTWIIWLRTVLIGAGLGVVFWILTLLLNNYVIEPLACRDIATANACLTTYNLSGNIAAIMTGAVGLLVMVRMGVFRPIILALATVALLWDLAALSAGLFWLESLAWSIILYAASYGLFAWIARYSRLWVAVVLSVLIILIIRIALVL